MEGLNLMDKTLSVRGARISFCIWDVAGALLIKLSLSLSPCSVLHFLLFFVIFLLFFTFLLWVCR